MRYGPGMGASGVSVRYPGVHVPDVVTVPAGDRGVLFPVTVDRSVDPYRYGTITVRWNGQDVTHRFFIY